MKEIEFFAIENHIPIIDQQSARFICNLINEYSVKNFLEVGSAIGYSALYFKTNCTSIKIDTIEKDSDRYKLALDNVKRLGYETDIKCYLADALLISYEELSLKTYDAIFIDAAKYRTIDFFNKFMPLLSKNGIIIIDNIYLRGWVYRLDEVKTKRKKRLVKQAVHVLDWLKNGDHGFEVDLFEVGDGIALLKRCDNEKTNVDNK